MKTLSTAELHQRFQEDHGQHTILDARSEAEFSEGHVPGAVNIPHDQLARRIAEVPKDRPVYVHCRMGPRAQSAARLLLTAGYDVWCVSSGGWFEWERRGHPVHRP